jgi:hypothetical protein
VTGHHPQEVTGLSLADLTGPLDPVPKYLVNKTLDYVLLLDVTNKEGPGIDYISQTASELSQRT